jgi:L-lactate dehydrogenase complex protein LldG
VNRVSKSLRSLNQGQGQVLDDIRRALGRNKTVAPTPLPAFIEESIATNAEEVVARFAFELTKVGGHVYRVSEEAQTSDGDSAPEPDDSQNLVGQVARQIVEICAATALDVALSASSAIAELKLADQLRERGLSLFVPDAADPSEHNQLVMRLATCAAGITAVDYAIAETGTLVLSSNEGNALLVSLLPPVHIALLRSGQISNSLGEAIAKLNIAGGNVYRSATLITGPSRTSDVELTLSIGVHGPKELHVIILD